MKCDFIGIGVQKGATTWVHSVLEDHPQVGVSQPKELDFFSREHSYAKGVNWYHSHFDFSSPTKKAYGEISPSYMHHTLSPFRVHDYNKNIKIIVTLRDPVDRAFSNHLHLIRWGVVKGEDVTFEYGLERYQMYIEQSRYYTILRQWYELFGGENILVLIQEEINQDPKQAAAKLYKFLSVDADFQSVNLEKRANVSKTVRFKVLEALFRKLAGIGNRLGFAKQISRIKKNAFISRLRVREIHLVDSVPKMRPETEHALKETLSEEMIQLQQLLGRNSLPWRTWEFAYKKQQESKKGLL